MIELHILPQNRKVPSEILIENDENIYHERLVAVLVETPISEVQAHPFVTVSPDLSVRRAISLMADRKIACLIVAEEGELRGIFTERDVLNKVAEHMESMSERPISDVMTPNPMYLLEGDSIAAAIRVMTDFGFRHVPVLDVSRQVIGIVSPQRVLSFLRQQWAQ